MPKSKSSLKWAATGLSRLVLAFGVTIISQPAMASETELARFEALYKAEWAWRQAEYPDFSDSKTQHLSDESLSSQKRRLTYWRGIAHELDRLDPTQLSEKDQINLRIFRAQIEVLINNQKFRTFEKPLNSDSAFWSDMRTLVQSPFRNEADYERYLGLLSEMPRYFDQELDNMKAGLARGFTPPRVTLNGREAGVLVIANASSIESNPYYQPFTRFPASFSEAIKAKLRAKAEVQISQSVVPAHKKLLQFLLQDYMPHATQKLAAESLPEGKAYYRAQIKEYTTLDMEPEAIHTLGLTEVASIRMRMQAIMTEVGFKGSLPQFLQFLRTDPQFYAKTPLELLMRAAWIAKRFDGKAAQYFGHLPRQRFGIIPVPDDIAPYYTSGRGGAGVYLVNTYDLKSRGLYSLPALTLHESAPGHAFQGSLSEENKTLPDFRSHAYISAYGEGWALYCETLGDEMGMYETPYERFGMLSYQMWRAARLVVDTGIHAKGWTREQAQAFLRDNTALSEHEIETEVDRYITWPGQALSYYLGELTILKARKKAEVALGAKFNLKAFHDTVLDIGSVPLPILEARIDKFIAEGGVGPYPDEEK